MDDFSYYSYHYDVTTDGLIAGVAEKLKEKIEIIWIIFHIILIIMVIKIATTYDVTADELITGVAEKLKEIPGVKAPEQLIYWKTASFKEISPVDHENFWYIRGASLLRKLYIRKVIGVNKLRKEYGGRNINHVKKKHSTLASGAIIRRLLQQLESVGLIKKVEGKGRALSPSGISLLDKTAMELYKKNPVERYARFGVTE